MAEIAPEMRLFSPTGERLYLTTEERTRFLKATDEKDRIERMFCEMVYYSAAVHPKR